MEFTYRGHVIRQLADCWVVLDGEGNEVRRVPDGWSGVIILDEILNKRL